MVENPVKQKSYNFALGLIKLRSRLKEHKHYEISTQLLEADMSVGASVEEALAAQSKKDFLNEMAIASKEAREANYWLRLLTDAGILQKEESKTLLTNSEELMKPLTSIVKTSSKKLGN